MKSMEPEKYSSLEFISFDDLLEKANNGENTSWMTKVFIKTKRDLSR
jgi:hypothetical protein